MRHRNDAWLGAAGAVPSLQVQAAPLCTKHVRGWEEVSASLDLAASNYRDGRDYQFENVSTVVTPELAYTVEIERIRTRVGRLRRAHSDRRPGDNGLASRGGQLEGDAPPRRPGHIDAPGGAVVQN